MSLQDDLNELQQKKDSRPPMIKYGDRPGNTIPNNDMNNNLDNVTVFGDVSADAAQISLDSANDAYESKVTSEEKATEALNAAGSANVDAGNAAIDAQRAKDEADRATAIAGFDGLHNTLAGRDVEGAHDASAIGFRQDGLGAVERSVDDRLKERLSVKDFGAVGDGSYHPLSSRFSTLGDAQKVYPHAKSLEDSLDWAALQSAINTGAEKGLEVTLSGSRLFVNRQINLVTGTKLIGPGYANAGPISGFDVGAGGTVDSHLGFFRGIAQNDITITGIEFDISNWTEITEDVGSVRAILFRRGSNLVIKNNTFRTTGGGPALIGCTDFRIQDNTLIVEKPGESITGYADGVIDIWVEWNISSERCIISGNIIRGNGYGRWGIMCTGLGFEEQVMMVKSLIISENIIEDIAYDGIWAFGRDAVMKDTVIANNIIKRVRKGISISDIDGYVVEGNIITDTPNNGIHLWSELVRGGTVGARNGIVANNSMNNTGYSEAGQVSAILVEHNSSNNLITGNSVKGGGHYYGIAVYPDAVLNRVVGNSVDRGRSATRYWFRNTKTRYEASTYSPTLTGLSNVSSSSIRRCLTRINDHHVTVEFSIDLTPTSTGERVRLGISLPYDTPVNGFTLFGEASINTEEGNVADIIGNESVNFAELNFTATFSGYSRRVNGFFTYLIND